MYTITYAPEAKEGLAKLKPKSPRLFILCNYNYLFFYCCRLLFLQVYGYFYRNTLVADA